MASPVGRVKKAHNNASWGQQVNELEKKYASDDVFHLPGKINISQLRKIKEIERSGKGAQIMKRFMVRGHWRRPATNWHEQYPIWIKPYWKGPDMALAIDREYRLKM